jgi:hypothetical protein
LAASASTVGAVPLLALQSVLLVTSAIMTSQLRLITPFEIKASAEPALARLWRELADGIVTVWRHERLWTIMFYLSLGAPLFNGMFLVGLPLMVRDVYHGSSGMLSLLFTAFLLGLTASSFGYSRVPAVERPGRLLMLLAPNNILVFAIASTAPAFPYFVALMFWWGLSSGVMMSLTRGMIQVAAPPAYRARVLSILQFANIAGGPLGAVLFGSIAQSTGILTAVAIIPFAVSLQWLGFRFLTRMWHFRREDPPEPPVTSPP